MVKIQADIAIILEDVEELKGTHETIIKRLDKMDRYLRNHRHALS